MPTGRDPLDMPHIRGPNALLMLIDALYDCPSVPCGRDDVTNDRGGMTIVMENIPVAVDEVLSVADAINE